MLMNDFLKIAKCAVLVVSVIVSAEAFAADTLVDSWLTDSGSKYARIYRSQADALAGNSVTTWFTGGRIVNGTQSVPVYGGVKSIRVSSNYVYVASSAMPTYVMGPWYLDATKTNLFPNWPTNQNKLYRIPRNPTPAVTKTRTSLGAVAVWVDGGIIHNQLDAFVWNGTTDVTAAGGIGSWQRDAAWAEGLTFDPSGSHQPFTGERHHHLNPYALRYQLGDHVDYNPATHTYTESTNSPQHSPILGWAFDGYPIYGPYGFSNPNDTNSAIRRMTTGYVLRNGSFGTANLTVTGRTSYPQWALDAGQPVNPSGPAVNADYPLGRYLQDYDHLADRGYTQGVHFDLDRHNGRICKTPEYPGGTYAYFITIDSNAAPIFPFILGRQYYGVKTGADYGAVASTTFTNVETPNVTVFVSGEDAASVLKSPQPSDSTVTLTWSSAEGGHYRVESSTNLTSWTTNIADVRAAGNQTQTNTVSTTDQRFFRVARTSVDNFDTVVTP